MKLAPEFLAHGELQYLDTMDEHNRVLCDPVITPFVLGMKAAGYQEILRQGCSILRGCPFCQVGKSNYSQQYKKNGRLVWACPHCHEISEA
jgi:hypothetical protein